MKIKKLSIIIPVFNEEETITKVVRAVQSIRLPGINKEIIVVNDGSTDKTKKKLAGIRSGVKIINLAKNKGKGAAVREGLRHMTGDVAIIQDADLEYDPHDIPKLLEPIQRDLADVVYGSRFLGGQPHRVLLFWHMVGNNLLTLLTNMITNLNLTDMETCYKVFTKTIARKLSLKENRFGFEPEFTVKIAKAKARVYEMGISYTGRSYSEGKKINWQDGVKAIWVMIKYGLLD